MVRNLIGLFGVVILAIWGFAWYHARSMAPIKALPIALFHWEDTTARATIQSVMQSAGFAPIRHRRQNVGYTKSIHWYRFRLPPDSLETELTLDVRNHAINALQLITVRDGHVISLTKTGDRFPFSQRPIPTKTFAFPLQNSPRQPTDYYLRLDKRYENLATEMTFWRTSDFDDKEQREYFLWGIFVGIVALVVLLNVLFWRTSNDPVYLWYAIYVTGLFLRQAADSGLGFQYLWPGFPALNAPDPIIQALWLYVPAMIQFQQYFLNLRQENKRLFQILQVLKYTFWAGFVGLLAAQLLHLPQHYPELVQVVTRIHSILANAAVLAFLWVIVVSLQSADALRQLYGAGLALQMTGQFVNIIQNVSRNQADGIYLVEPYLLTVVIFFIDLVVFTYLLAYRYRQSLREHQTLTLNLTRTQQHTNQKIIQMLDAEREQVQHLLHADVSQRLQQARHLLTSVVPSAQLTDSVRLIQKADADLDEIAQNRLPVAVAEKGVAAALSELIEQLNQTQPVQFTFVQTGGNPALSVSQDVQLYRIATELMNNIRKHAQATQARVLLAHEAGDVSLTVSDNGRGFDATSAGESHTGIGLKNLYARTRELHADVTLNSGEDGTTIVVRLPQKIQTS
ncbi:sensor histidine kinase [Spirosoma luteum]|uniref:sensor histidine kinase n=1 Tax=Spirosoma luteum TaxID=431553 RepID=UPI000370C1B0|nr:7TM-DISM domain-containing protein [Spirosoma luteum]